MAVWVDSGWTLIKPAGNGAFQFDFQPCAGSKLEIARWVAGVGEKSSFRPQWQGSMFLVGGPQEKVDIRDFVLLLGAILGHASYGFAVGLPGNAHCRSGNILKTYRSSEIGPDVKFGGSIFVIVSSSDLLPTTEAVL